MFLNRLTLFVMALSLALCSCSRSNSSSEDVPKSTQVKTLKIAYIPITHALPLFMACELPDSLKQSKSIELVKFGSWPELVEALNTGRVDGASMLIQLALKSKEAGFPIKAVALGHRDGNVVVVAPEINSPQDLIGKTIAIPHRLSSLNFLFRMMIEKAGIDITKMNVIELPPPEMPAALSEKRVQAYFVAEPFGAKGVVSGAGKVLYQSEEVWPNSVCCALVLRDSVIKNNPAETKALMQDYLRAGTFLAANPDAALPVMMKYMNAKEPVLRKSLEWIEYGNLTIDTADYKVLTDWMLKLELSKTPPAYSDFVDNSFTKEYYKK